MTTEEWENQPLEEKNCLVRIGLGKVQAGAELAEERMKLNQALDDDDETDDEEEVITTEKRVSPLSLPNRVISLWEKSFLPEKENATRKKDSDRFQN